MNKRIIAYMALPIFLSFAAQLHGAESVIDGVNPGDWTMDLDAAKKEAHQKKLPILLNFSGSDWCSWCKHMEAEVFTKEDWKKYAADNLIMVLIDFPNDKSLVPEKYTKRNKELSDKYNVRGFPTFFLLDSDGETILGQLGADREITPQKFISSIQNLCCYRESTIAEFCKALPAEKKKAYLDLMAHRQKTLADIEGQEAIIEAAQKRLEELAQELERVNGEAKEFLVAIKHPEKVKAFKEIKNKLEAAKQQLNDWIETKPDRSDENMKKFQQMKGEIDKLSAEYAEFLR